MEYTGLLVGIAVVITAVVLAMAPTRFSDAVKRAFCLVFTLGQGGCSDPEPSAPTDESFKPADCLVNGQGEKYGYEYSFGWMKIGNEYAFARQEMADGSIQLVAVDTASVGATGEKSGEPFNIGKIGDTVGEVEGEASGTLKIGYGDTWQFTSDDSGTAKEKADKFEAAIKEYSEQKAGENGPNGLAMIIWNKIHGYTQTPTPDVSLSKVSGEVGVQGGLQVRLKQPGTDETTDPHVGASLELAGEYEVAQEKYRNGDTSWTYQLSGEVKGGATAVVPGVEGSGKTTGAFKVTRDKDGKVTQLAFVSTREGGLQVSSNAKKVKGENESTGKAGGTATTATVTTTTLNINSDEQRAVVQNWLSENNEKFGTPVSLTTGSLVPDQKPDQDDAFGNLMYSQATVSQAEYSGVTDVEEFGAEVNLGMKFGFSVSHEESTSQATDATFLGAPQADGTRALLDYAECR